MFVPGNEGLPEHPQKSSPKPTLVSAGYPQAIYDAIFQSILWQDRNAVGYLRRYEFLTDVEAKWLTYLDNDKTEGETT